MQATDRFLPLLLRCVVLLAALHICFGAAPAQTPRTTPLRAGKGECQDDNLKALSNWVEESNRIVHGVHFFGNTFAMDDQLRTVVGSKGSLNMACTPEMIEADTTMLVEYYRAFGYLDVRVSHQLHLSDIDRDANVVFHIQEGQRYRMKSKPYVRGNKVVPSEQLKQLIKVKQGQFYSQGDIESDVERIKAYYGYTGREVRIQAIPIFTQEVSGVCRVKYEVEELPPPRGGQIIIIGNEPTPKNWSLLRPLPAEQRH